MENRHCLRAALPAHLYTVREKYLKRFRALARSRISQVLGVTSTLACGMPPEAHRRKERP